MIIVASGFTLSTSSITASTAEQSKKFFTVVVGWSRYDHKVSSSVCFLGIKGCGEIQFLLGKIHLYIVVLDRRFSVVDKFNLFRNDIDRSYMVVLCKKRCD